MKCTKHKINETVITTRYSNYLVQCGVQHFSKFIKINEKADQTI